MRAVTIYTVGDATGDICYVGATNQPLMQRLGQHRYEGRLRALNSEVVLIEPLETVYGEWATDMAETYWAEQFRAWGFDLQNRRKTTPYRADTRFSAPVFSDKKAWMATEEEYKADLLDRIRRWNEIKVGDTIPLNEYRSLTVKKKNRKSLISDTGRKWSARTLFGTDVYDAL